MSGINFVGEFELQEIKLTSVQGNILNFISDVNLVAVDIFENIFKTGITGSIVFADTNNFVENLPIIGQERLTFKAATPSFVNKEDIIDFTETPFIVYKIQKIDLRIQKLIKKFKNWSKNSKNSLEKSFEKFQKKHGLNEAKDMPTSTVEEDQIIDIDDPEDKTAVN